MMYNSKMKKNKIVVYTAIYGETDSIIEPRHKLKNIDLVCFTNRDDLVSKNFKIIKQSKKYKSDNLSAKFYKVNPHKIFRTYDYSCWIDARILIKSPIFDEFIMSYLKKHSWAMYRHQDRDNIYDEADICIRWGKGDPEKIRAQVEKYKEDGYKAENGLFMGGVILRKHNEKDVIKLNEFWWKEIKKHSLRDQLSFPYALWKTGTEITAIKYNLGNPVNDKFLRVLSYKQRDMYKNDLIDSSLVA